MRLSTNTIYAAGVSRLSELQAGIVKTQQQISTGRRILTPSDDPVGAANALNLSQGQAINTQFATNRTNATNSLSTEEGILQGTTSLLQDVKTLVVSAGNGILSDTDRGSIAVNLQGRLSELIGQANATDGTGNYLFGGFQVSAPPFTATATGASYTGDQGLRYVQVSTSRQTALTDTGAAVFQNVASSGVYTTAAATAPANTGTATVSALTTVDATLLKNHDYAVTLGGVAGALTYTVQDTTTNTTAASGTYTSGQAITFDGRQLTVTDGSTPLQPGDSFSARQDQHQSVFKTISDLITALQTPTTAPGAKASLSNALAVGNGNIDNALNNVLTVRASIGSRLKELDALNTSGDDRNLQFASALSQIQDVDYNKAISDFTQQNTTLEAAQKSFVKISSMSLFSLL